MKAKPLGVALGLAGNVAVGWALFNLIQIGSCGGDGAPPCPDDSWPYFVALTVGIMLSIAGSFAGGVLFGIGGLFLAIGLGSIGAGIWGDESTDRTFAYIFGGGFAFFGALPLTGAVLARPLLRRRVERAERLVATGRRAIGTVTRVRDTGVTINNDPRVEVTMSIEPTDGSAPFERSKARVVPRVDIPRAGDRFPVFYDGEDPGYWAWGTEMQPDAPADIRALFEQAAQQQPASEGAAASAPPVPPAGPSPLDELSKLNDLRMKGVLSDEEFQVAKDRLLAQLGGGGAS